jgi:plasmid stabilization system protein ParE
VARSVVFAPETLADLRSLYDIIADASQPARARLCCKVCNGP